MKKNQNTDKEEINNFYPLFFTAVFILILFRFSFSYVEGVFYDLWNTFSPHHSLKNKIVLIYMDESNDQILGEYYPYTFATHTSFLDKVLKDKPLMLNYFISFDEPNEDDDKEFYQNFYGRINDFKKIGGGFRFGTDLDYWGEQLPPKDLKKLGFSLALINVDGESFAKDSVHRQAILNISGEDSFHLWATNYIKESQSSKSLEASNIWGARYDKDIDATFAHYRSSFNLIRVDKNIVSIPFYRVLNGNIPPGFFKDKIVLVGPQYSSNKDDFVYTSFSKDVKSPKLAVHASIIDSLVSGRTIFNVPDWITDLFSLLMAVALSFIISRVKPTRGLAFTIGLTAFVLIFAYLLFFLGLWIKVAHLLLSIFIVFYIWFPFRAIAEYQTRYAVEEEAFMLKRVENLKQNFISLMSHDLKTPVAKIAGMADLLKLKLNKDETDNLKIADDILGSTKELNEFITSILDLTKIESKNLQINLVSKDVNKIVEAVTDKLEYEAESKNIEVSRELSPLYPIEIDSNLIHRVISNLVENAIKYCPEGSKIFVETSDDDKWVYISIKDNGDGIAEKDLDHIFDKFYRVKNDDSHTIKGSGLGLYLVKYFIELHKGEIYVESVVGVGTTFTIKLINK